MIISVFDVSLWGSSGKRRKPNAQERGVLVAPLPFIIRKTGTRASVQIRRLRTFWLSIWKTGTACSLSKFWPRCMHGWDELRRRGSFFKGSYQWWRFKKLEADVCWQKNGGWSRPGRKSWNEKNTYIPGTFWFFPDWKQWWFRCFTVGIHTCTTRWGKQKTCSFLQMEQVVSPFFSLIIGTVVCNIL